MTTNRKTSEERKEILARTIASQIALGRRIESQSDYQAVLVRGRPVNHVLHLLLTFLTISLWAWVWLALIVFGGEKREIVQVDEWGTPTIARL